MTCAPRMVIASFCSSFVIEMKHHNRENSCFTSADSAKEKNSSDASLRLMLRRTSISATHRDCIENLEIQRVVLQRKAERCVTWHNDAAKIFHESVFIITFTIFDVRKRLLELEKSQVQMITVTATIFYTKPTC